MELYLQATEGEINPLDAYIKLSEIEKLAGEYKDKLKEIVLPEAAKFNKQAYNGYVIELTERKTLDYSHIQDWNEYKAKIKEIETKAKSLFEMSGNDIADMQTGEIIQAARLKQVTSVITLKKVK